MERKDAYGGKWLLPEGKNAGEHHTAEDWLEILQNKSLTLGRAISWHEIKQDPNLNHVEIMAELGPYAKYERLLFADQTTHSAEIANEISITKVNRAKTRGVRKTKQAQEIARQFQTLEVPPPVVRPRTIVDLSEEHKQETKRKIQEANLKRQDRLAQKPEEAPVAEQIEEDSSPEPIAILPVPAAGEKYLQRIWPERGIVVIAELDDQRIEQSLDAKDTVLLEVEPTAIEEISITRVLHGLIQDYRPTMITVYADKIEIALVKIDACRKELTAAKRVPKIVFCGKPNVPMNLHISLNYPKSYGAEVVGSYECYWDGRKFASTHFGKTISIVRHEWYPV